MSVVTVELYSAALGRTTTYSALVPEVGAPPWAVLYLLHGHDDDHRAWLYKSSLLRHAAGLPLLIVMPSGENSYYVGAHERLIVDDLPADVARTFRAREGRAAIGGLSMGGYGAIRLGLKYPERYASIYAHSSRLPARAELPSLPWAGFADGDEAALDDLDVDTLAARVDGAAMGALSFDCGTDDPLLPDNARFHARLHALDVPHQYREHPGAHTWEYWDRHVVDALAHHARALGL
ncbi:MAG: putative esterase [Myxococcales bacterium]|nr:putative esterase [Myxococcales bacterium]